MLRLNLSLKLKSRKKIGLFHKLEGRRGLEFLGIILSSAILLDFADSTKMAGK